MILIYARLLGQKNLLRNLLIYNSDMLPKNHCVTMRFNLNHMY